METITTQFDKNQCKLLNWLRKSLSKDSARSTLQNIFVKNGQVVSCDGFRIHSIPTPDNLKEYQGKTLHAMNKSSSANNIEGFEIVEDVTYPDIDQVWPKKPRVFRIGVNPKFLIDALSGFDGHVSITFYSDHEPLLVKSTDPDNQEQAALIMPVYLNDDGFTS